MFVIYKRNSNFLHRVVSMYIFTNKEEEKNFSVKRSLVIAASLVKHDLKGVLKCLGIEIWTHPTSPPQTVTEKPQYSSQTVTENLQTHPQADNKTAKTAFKRLNISTV